MVRLILKYWRLLIDIAIVVGVIVAFTFWDPFGMFTKTQTRATANMVTSIREIGQLVTAEYYGEVMSSLKEAKITKIPEDTISVKAKNLFVDLKYDLHSSRSIDNVLNLVSETRSNYKDIYDELLAYLGTIYLGDKDITTYYSPRYKRLRNNKEKKILKALRSYDKQIVKRLEKRYRNNDIKYDEKIGEYLEDIPENLNDFYKSYLFLTKESLSVGSEKRKNIVFIGRGWVKAGFDFEKLDERNFLYDSKKKIVHFYGMNASVLDTDINPWFIPERKVKGYELVDYSGKVTFEDAKEVKHSCKQKLLDQARKAEIIQKANENGKEALRNFFSLLLDEPNLRVEMHTRPYANELAIISADTLISFNEAFYIDSLYREEVRRIDKMEEPDSIQASKFLGYFIEDLKALSFYRKGYPFSYYSVTAAGILKDTFHISARDLDVLQIIRDTILLNAQNNDKSLTTKFVSTNPLWFQNSDFRVEFNQMIKFCEEMVYSLPYLKTISIDSTITDKLRYLLINKPDSKILGYPYYSNSSFKSDSLIRYLPIEEIEKNKIVLSDYNYSVIDLEVNKDSIYYRASLFLDDTLKTFYYNKAEALYNTEKKAITSAVKNQLTYEKQMAPLEKIKEFTNKLFANK